jgi:hypothetical protein
MKSIFTIFGIVFYSMLFSQTTYTFHTAGNWTTASNWNPSYPGANIDNATININAQCTLNLGEALTFDNNSVFNNFASFSLPSNFNYDIYFLNNSQMINHTNGQIINSNPLSLIVSFGGPVINNGLIDAYIEGFSSFVNSGTINGAGINGSYCENNGTINCSFFECGGVNNGNITSNIIRIADEQILTNNNIINAAELNFRRFGNGTQPTLINNGTISGNTIFTNPLTNGTTCNPTFTNNGILSPGSSPGKIDINLLSPYNGCPNIGIYNCEINGATPTTQYDQITVTNCANLTNAALNVTWGFTPSIGQEFDIVTHGSRTGQFAVVNIPPISGLNFTLDYSDPSKTSIVVSSALPVTWLSSPTANIKNEQTHISWSIASQVNNSHFIIEHSKDGRSYSEIGKVEGHGNTSETKQYTYIHELPSIGINFYRIKQVDYDGQRSYSDVVSVMYESDGGDVRIYPNPAKSEVTIQTSNLSTLQIIDVYGRILSNQQLITEELSTVNLSEFPSGILIFVIGDQRIRVLKE